MSFADVSRRRLGLGRVRLTDGALERLSGADRPGNVRELENVLSRAVLRAAGASPAGEAVTVGAEHLDVAAAGPTRASDSPVPAPSGEGHAPSASASSRSSARRSARRWCATAAAGPPPPPS